MYFLTGLRKGDKEKLQCRWVYCQYCDQYIVVNIVNFQQEKLVPEANFHSSLALYLKTRSRTLKKDKGEKRTPKDCLLWQNSALIFNSLFGYLIKYVGWNLCFFSNQVDISDSQLSPLMFLLNFHLFISLLILSRISLMLFSSDYYSYQTHFSNYLLLIH